MSINVLRNQSNRVRANVRFQIDYWLLLIVICLIGFGLLMVYSATFDLGIRARSDAIYYFRRQLQAAGIGLVGILIIMQFDYTFFTRFSVPIMVGTIGILIALPFIGEELQGATRGFSQGSYSPSELAKLTLILYISHWLASKGDRIKDITFGLFPFAFITGSVCAMVVSQPDLSTAILIALTAFTIFFIAGADWRQFLLAAILGGAVFSAFILTFPHSRARLTSYLTSVQDPTLAHDQVQQGIIALANGRLFGIGIGRGVQKFDNLPAAHTDGMFAIIGEEVGLIGTMAVMIIFALLVWRGILIASKAKTDYGKLVAIGISCWFAYQALIHMAVVTAVIPVTGMPLPFMSYGGTSMAVCMFGAGFLLSISRDAAQNRPLRKQSQANQSITNRRKSSEKGGSRRRSANSSQVVQLDSRRDFK
ncbi:MAG: putative peptidoglycan glycosyltransferase FtsW [Chloroflexota bacterium]